MNTGISSRSLDMNESLLVVELKSLSSFYVMLTGWKKPRRNRHADRQTDEAIREWRTGQINNDGDIVRGAGSYRQVV